MSSVSQESILVQAVKDPWTIVASSGATVLIAIDWVVTHFSPIAGMIGAAGGLVALSFSIIQKRREARAAAIVLMMREVELRQMMKEIGDQEKEEADTEL